MQGAGVRLYGPENGVLAVAEGIETALAARVGSGLPCWAAVSAWGLQNIVLPESVTDAYVMGDNDISGTGQRAAHALARRMQEEERQVRVEIPSRPGDDWLDVLNERQRIEVA
jgi:putative DNA primase/helicase